MRSRPEAMHFSMHPAVFSWRDIFILVASRVVLQACPSPPHHSFVLVVHYRSFSPCVPPPLCPRYPRGHLTHEGSTARLNCLNLGSAEGRAAEAKRELGDVESNAVGSMNGAKAGARSTADAATSAEGLLEGTVLLGVVTVGAEGVVHGRSRAAAVVGKALRKRSSGGGRVRLGGVVNVGRNSARTDELDEGNTLSVDSSLSESSSGGEHYGGLD